MHAGELRQHLGSLQQQINGLNGVIQGLQGGAAGFGALKADVDKVISEQEKAKALLQQPRYIEDIPGPRMPYTYVVNVPFTAADTASQTDSVTIAADGPFVVTSMTAFWRPTDSASAFVNQWLPITRLPFRVGGVVPATLEADVAFLQLPEFSLKLTTGGSGRFWQSDWLGGPLFDQTRGDRPWYTGIAGWIERTNTLSVEVRPEIAIPANNTGEVWVYFHGYQILIPINLAEQFGWSI
jgi:hypothetical protein